MHLQLCWWNTEMAWIYCPQTSRYCGAVPYNLPILNVSIDSQDQLSQMSKEQIKTFQAASSWYVKFRLAVQNFWNAPGHSSEISDMSFWQEKTYQNLDKCFIHLLSRNHQYVLINSCTWGDPEVLSPIFKIPISLTCIGSQSPQNPANTATDESMK